MLYKKKIKTSVGISSSLLLHSGALGAQGTEFMTMMTVYEGAMKEVSTMLEILDAEFRTLHDHNPIHHIESRIKKLSSIISKMERKGLNTTIANIKEHLTDIVGLRIVCPYIEDIYKICDLLCSQERITVIRKSDYIQNPKPNGYRSLHLVVLVPVSLSDRTEQVPVEIQLRTIAMDMWASLEHELHYKSTQQPVEHLSERLRRCAVSLADVDLRMQEIYNHLKGEEEGQLDEIAN